MVSCELAAPVGAAPVLSGKHGETTVTAHVLSVLATVLEDQHSDLLSVEAETAAGVVSAAVGHLAADKVAPLENNVASFAARVDACEKTDGYLEDLEAQHKYEAAFRVQTEDADEVDALVAALNAEVDIADRNAEFDAGQLAHALVATLEPGRAACRTKQAALAELGQDLGRDLHRCDEVRRALDDEIARTEHERVSEEADYEAHRRFVAAGWRRLCTDVDGGAFEAAVADLQLSAEDTVRTTAHNRLHAKLAQKEATLRTLLAACTQQAGAAGTAEAVVAGCRAGCTRLGALLDDVEVYCRDVYQTRLAAAATVAAPISSRAYRAALRRLLDRVMGFAAARRHRHRVRPEQNRERLCNDAVARLKQELQLRFQIGDRAGLAKVRSDLDAATAEHAEASAALEAATAENVAWLMDTRYAENRAALVNGLGVDVCELGPDAVAALEHLRYPDILELVDRRPMLRAIDSS